MSWCVMAILLVVRLAVAAPSSPSRRNAQIDRDAVYFPDQVEYIRSAYGKCQDQRHLYWPGDGRCYSEGARGPCAFGYHLVWEERWYRPRCIFNNDVYQRHRHT